MEETARLTTVAATSVNVLWGLEARTVPKVSVIVLEIHLTIQLTQFNTMSVLSPEIDPSLKELGTISTN